jgi:putative redox protein
MKITLNRIDQDFHFEAVNEEGLSIQADGSPAIGGHNKAVRPMQMLLSSLASCSAIDVVHLLRKQKQELNNIKIEVKGEREAGKIPAVFTDIHLHYILYGEINTNKAKRAVNLSMEKLCSVKQMLDKAANITWSWEIQE